MCLDGSHAHPHLHGHPHGSGPQLAAPLRVAIVGKGGAGKTTIAGALARVLDLRGVRVLAVDADPDANLASALPLDRAAPPEPLARQRELLREATERAGVPEGLFLLNPDTGALLPRSTVTWGRGQSLVALGWGKAGGEGCYCAEHALLRRLLSKATAATAEVTLIDSEAGLEHLSRGTIAGIDLALAVVEPGRRSAETAEAIRALAADLGIARVRCVVTGYRSAEELETVRGWLAGWPPVAAFPFDEGVRRADLEGAPPVLAGAFLAAAEGLADYVLGQERAP
jgi:CO dehydrogenase maturation factor